MMRMRVSEGLGRRAAPTLALLCAALAAATLLLHALNWGRDPYRWLPGLAAGSWAIDAFGALAWCVPGLLIARRRPDLPFGWLALAAALGHGLAGAGLEWATLSELGGHRLPGAAAGLWLAAWGGEVELPVLAVFYVTFPQGRRPVGRFGAVAIVAAAVVLVGVVAQALCPFATSLGLRPGSPFDGLSNPVGLGALGGMPGGVPFFAVGMLLAGGLVVVRWRRAAGEERQVLRWMVGVAAAGPLVVAAVLLLPPAVGLAVAEIETFLRVEHRDRCRPAGVRTKSAGIETGRLGGARDGLCDRLPEQQTTRDGRKDKIDWTTVVSKPLPARTNA